MKRTRKHYDKEFKEMAVNLVLSGKSSSEVADDLGINYMDMAGHHNVGIDYETFLFNAYFQVINHQIVIASSCKNIYPANYGEVIK